MQEPHPYIPNSSRRVKEEMLHDLGLDGVEALFGDIPDSIRKKSALNLSPVRSELETKVRLEDMLSRNFSTRDVISFLGGGVWPHYVPAAVDEIVSRSEFLTSYTPYQPEI